jgi:hypothetical protein
MKRCKSLNNKMVCLSILISFLSWENSAADEPSKFYFESGLQVNYSSHYLPTLYSQAKVDRYLFLDQTMIFPGAELIGEFLIRNNSDISLKLGSNGQPLKQFIGIQFTYEDSLGTSHPLEASIREVVYVYTDSVETSWGEKNFLPSKGKVQVNGNCYWSALAQLHYGFLKLNWVFDNTQVAQTDSSITPVRWVSEDYLFKYSLPETRVDSIYYFNQRGFYLNSKREFQEALEFSLKTLRLDSLDYDALEIASDVLWKMNRFNEALVYAQRGKQVIQNAAQTIAGRGGEVDYDNTQRFIDRMNFFIDKCQKREPWQGGK